MLALRAALLVTLLLSASSVLAQVPDTVFDGITRRDIGPVFMSGPATTTSIPDANIGPSFVTLDARLSKLFTMDRTRFELFIEGFNTTNKVNYASPTGNLRSALFGTSTAIQGNMRQIELGFRFDF